MSAPERPSAFSSAALDQRILASGTLRQTSISAPAMRDIPTGWLWFKMSRAVMMWQSDK